MNTCLTRRIAATTLLAWLGAAGCGSDAKSDDPAAMATDAATDTPTPVGENPRICDTDCPVVDNARGSKTKTLVLKAKGEVKTFPVDGVDVAVHVSTYNGTLPGPTVEIETTASNPDAPVNSDVLLIDLTNEGGLNGCCYHQCPTPRDPESCWEPYCKGTGLHQGDACVQVDTSTNIHTHGFHTAAATTAGGAGDACTLSNSDPADPHLPWDNIFVSIPPSGTESHAACSGGDTCEVSNRQSFMFPLGPQSVTDAFQPAAVKYPQWFGLQWYHPHIHEQSKDQLERGLAGAIIVRNPAEGRIPVLAAIPRESERILVLQRLPMDSSEMIQNDFVRIINGKVKPQFTIKAGETQRWRIVNAGSDFPIHLSLDLEGGDSIAFHPIGFDGIPTPDIRPALTSYWLAGGSRFEALITAPAGAAVGATYNLTWCETDQAAGSGEPTDDLNASAACTGTTVVGATLKVVEGAATPVQFNTGDPFADLASFGLVPDLWASEDGLVKRTIKFTQTVDASAGAQFFLDVGDGEGDQQFSHHQVCHAPITATLGAVEEWTLENWTTDIHSFHLHVNPFQAEPASRDPALGDGAFYQDNLLLPIGIASEDPREMGAVVEPGRVRIRVKHLDYVGTSVFHCHLLTHEDHGMMAAIQVTP